MRQPGLRLYVLDSRNCGMSDAIWPIANVLKSSTRVRFLRPGCICGAHHLLAEGRRFPLGHAIGKAPKRYGNCRPRPEMPLKNAGTELFLPPILNTRRNVPILPNEGAAVLEKCAIVEPDVRGVGLESGCPKGFAPAGEVLQHLILSHPRVCLESRLRWRPTERLGGAPNGIQDGLFAWQRTRHARSVKPLQLAPHCHPEQIQSPTYLSLLRLN